jgi:hypothetical protein
LGKGLVTSMPRPVKLEILSLLPMTYKQCQHREAFYDQSGVGPRVHDQMLTEYPQDLLEDHDRIVSLVIELTNQLKDGIVIHIIDPQSLKGIWKSLRYRVRKYPAFIIDDQELIIGWNRAALDRALESCLAE